MNLRHVLGWVALSFAWAASAAELRIGIIGLDTSHATAFTRLLNDPSGKDHVSGGRVVAAFKGGSPDLEASRSRVEQYTQELKEKWGVKIFDSIEAMCREVDAVMLESVDGRPHLAQARPVIEAGLPLYIDKPMAASLRDVREIFRLAKARRVPVFSASSLRFAANTQAARGGALGRVLEAETFSPCHIDPTHPDLFWYGIHGVESLFTVMGQGCESVRRGKTADGKIEVVGTWSGGRKGTYREGEGYGGKARGDRGESPVGSFDGYAPLVSEIVKFFRTGVPPVPAEETLEIFAFMEAADLSARRNGGVATLLEVNLAAAVNYDESKVPEYTLPDPLTFADGRRVSTADDWKRSRRAEVLNLFRDHVYGHRPGAPQGMKFEMRSTAQGALGGVATRKEVRVWRAGREGGPFFDLLLYVPANIKGRVPAFLGLNFEGNHAITRDPGVAITQSWVRDDPREGRINHRATEASRGSASSRWPVETILSRGYALATVYYGDLEPDHAEGWKNGVRSVFPVNRGGPTGGQGEQTPGPTDWGALAAWGWGLSRALDYLEQDSDIDAARVALLGHSRLGKTALWAGAEDERFAIVISNNSGCGGAALSRRAFGETVARINSAFPHWFCDQFNEYNWREEALPVDQHELIALIAPRPVYVASAEKDQWADPRGEFLSARAAEPVYALFGKSGLGAAEMPGLNQPVGDVIGYHYRTGVHDVTPYDWAQYLDFADRHFGRPRPSVELRSCQRIWSDAAHNAFTDLVRHGGDWFCVFREGKGHVSPEGAIRVLTTTSDEGRDWVSAARLTSERGDLRDPKVVVMPDGRLMLTAAVAIRGGEKTRHQTLAWFSTDGRDWGEPANIGELNVWLWRVAWHDDTAYGVGYDTGGERFVRLYRSGDGRTFESWVPRLFAEGYPNESALVWEPDGSAVCLLRRDGQPGTAQVGRSEYPFARWEWTDLGVKIGGPQLLRLPDGRHVAGVRLYDGGARTSLAWLDPKAGVLSEFMRLPSGGDTSYPGLVWHDGRLWVSYYSSHEDKTAIYLAQVDL